MRCLAAPAREDSPRLEEAVDIFRLGLLANQDDLLAGTPQPLGLVGVEHDLSGRRPG